ncbi:hypothetical protein IQ273_19030 [Nodosilinea sp. LEGE 07298]|uniref:hypothetical protein n=1 Tax=Nodosilinea sp. LEGE 07298 TaxID=2777970 RepID=UPI00187FEEB7|nr:hypothetical protein [Nodosilinea sp. LEGE 07298]MBE9111502.1 hypothetical protein [Nodosilinea sp. LEGE 07298]
MAAVSASSALAQSTEADWVEITRNAVGDRFMVERNSIELRNGAVWYWEHRDFPQPNNAFIGVELGQPVYGVTLYRSADCVGGVARLRQIIARDQEQQVIQRLNYGDAGPLSQPQSGSSAAAVLSFVCEQVQSAPDESQS